MTQFSIPVDPSDETQSTPGAPLRDGIHTVILENMTIRLMTKGQPTMVGKPEACWSFRVSEGPCKGAVIRYQTPLDGHIIRKDGKTIAMNWLSKRVVVALDPTIVEYSKLNTADFIGKKCQLEVQVRLQDNGASSIFPNVLNVFPWIKQGSTGKSPAVSDSKEPVEEDSSFDTSMF